MDTVIKTLVDEYGMTVSLADAASIIGCHVDTARTMYREGRLPGHTVRGRTMCLVPDLVQWMREGGEDQYDPTPLPPSNLRRLRPRRRADRPAWMDVALTPAT